MRPNPFFKTYHLMHLTANESRAEIRSMGVLTAFICWIFTASSLRADFGNFNSVLLGERASGMGGAFVAMTGDPASTSFYNPASLSLAPGSSFSASANLYNKYDTSFTNTGNLSDSAVKMNRGSFQAIPAAAGTSLSYGTFAVGISVITPDYNIFNGDVSLDGDTNQTTFINLKDQSLWVGGNLAINFTEKLSLGITAYYTSRDYSRSITEQNVVGNNTVFSYETKTFTSNNVLYVLGGMYRLTERIRFGSSIRFPSIQLSGDGSYYRSQLDTSQSNKANILTKPNITAQTIIPPKFSLGAAYEIPKVFALSAQLDSYGAVYYQDMDDSAAGEAIRHDQVINYSLGGEYYLRNWLALRGGVFTNLSSHPDITDNGEMQNDHIDMLGFSANVGFFTGNTSITFGGYFTGGKGNSTVRLGQRVRVLPKTQYIYAMLISSSYYF